MLKKNVVLAAAATAMIFTLSTGHAAGKGKGGNGGSAVIGYEIDPHSCEVTVTSTKDISNIVIKNADGDTIKKWDGLSGKSFSDFGMYAAYLPEGSLHIKSGNNGVRGLGPDIEEYEDGFRADLAACLEPPTKCPCVDEGSSWLTQSPTFVEQASGGQINYVIRDLSDEYTLEVAFPDGSEFYLGIGDFGGLACANEIRNAGASNITYTAIPIGFTLEETVAECKSFLEDAFEEDAFE